MDPMSAADEFAAAVGAELERFSHLTFAVLFGSAAAGRLRPDSDLDVAVYGASAGRLEIEQEREIDRETEIQIALERATQRNVELLVLNRAPATVCAAALTSGRVVLMRDGAFYSRYFLAVTSVAIDFLQTEREYRAIRDRSRSLSPVDRSRLERIADARERGSAPPGSHPEQSRPDSPPDPACRDRCAHPRSGTDRVRALLPAS